MKSLREWAGVIRGRFSSKHEVRPRAVSRRFRPLAEAVEGRVLLSHAGLLSPSQSAVAGVAQIVVNGQVELQPDTVVRAVPPA